MAVEIVRRDGDAGRIEILANGLAFDLSGLAPAAAAEAPTARHVFGLPDRPDVFAFEALRLAPGEHIAAGAAMLPLVRVTISLALGLSRLPSLRAVCWHPAASWMDAGYFARVMQAWLAGGLFPALGLAGMVQQDGAVRSQGLRFFTGQEVHVEALPREMPADTVRLAVRLADFLVRTGRINGPRTFEGPDDEPLHLEPADEGRVVRLRRSAAPV